MDNIEINILTSEEKIDSKLVKESGKYRISFICTLFTRTSLCSNSNFRIHS